MHALHFGIFHIFTLLLDAHVHVVTCESEGAFDQRKFSSHYIIFLKHLLWVYVDDFLAAFQKATAPLHLSLWIMLLLCIRLPISWSKCSIDDSIVWIGWRISFDTWCVELPEDKVHRILDQLATLSKQTKVKVKDLESIIGRLLWLTGLWRLLRPLLQPLYAALRDIPCTLIAVSPQLWTQILASCDDSGRLTRSLNHASFPEGARITRAGNTVVSSLAQMKKVPFIKRRLWVSVQDAEHPLRCLSQTAVGALQSWNSILSATPCVFNIKQAPLLQLVAEADAFADQDQCGLGGYTFCGLQVSADGIPSIYSRLRRRNFFHQWKTNCSITFVRWSCLLSTACSGLPQKCYLVLVTT